MALIYTDPPRPRLGRARWRDQAVALAPAALTLVLATVVYLVGWRGVDQAAQAYRVIQFREHGLMLWDSGWYGGNFPLGYSVLFPPVAAVLGIPVTAVLSAAIATWAFDRVVTAYFGSRPLGTWYFAISTLLPVAIGQLPFLAGEAAGLAALVFLHRGHKKLAVGLGILSALFSPLAAAFLAMACLAWAARSSRWRGWLVATAAVSLGVILVIGALFPGDGPFPFPWTGLVPTELLCLTALTPLVRTTPAVRIGALFYAAASLFSFLIPNPLGGNAPRLAASIGVPLLACFCTARGEVLTRLSPSGLVRWSTRGRRIDFTPRWRVAAVALVVPFAVWQWAPSQKIVSTSSAPDTQKSFYQPLIDELALVAPNPVRVEIPPTLEHWEAAFVAPHVSLARGWERQLDIADNPLFYSPGALTAASYEKWLDDEGVTYVALPVAPLDYAAQGEAKLLESGQVTTLVPVWHTDNWQLWRVVGSPGLTSGPARLTALGPDHVSMDVTRPGPITLRVRYTSFWHVGSGAGCVGPANGGWTLVDAYAAGPVSLTATVLHTGPSSTCPAPFNSSSGNGDRDGG